MTSDADLLTAAEHDPLAFRELYDRYAEVVYGFFKRRSDSHDAALDLTAETFAQAWESRGRFRDRRDGSAGPWLFGIARNVLRRSVRRQRTVADARRRLGLAGFTSEVEPVEAWLDGLDDDLAATLRALPDSQRRAIELRVIEDLDYHTVSDELGCTPTAARIRVSRGLHSLRSTLSHDQIAEGGR